MIERWHIVSAVPLTQPDRSLFDRIRIGVNQYDRTAISAKKPAQQIFILDAKGHGITNMAAEIADYLLRTKGMCLDDIGKGLQVGFRGAKFGARSMLAAYRYHFEKF